MINKAAYNLSLTRQEFKQLAAIRPWKGNHWNAPPNNEIKAIKIKIRQQLIAAQNVCSYCGLELGGTSSGEIEHIAPKGKSKNPEFTFTLKNLTLACHLCNFTEKKGQNQSISNKNKTYKKCDFLLVHPYFDDPDTHYEWTDNNIELLIQVRNNSSKGLFSINMFELDTPKMNELRASQFRHSELKIARHLSIQDEELLAKTLEFK